MSTAPSSRKDLKAALFEAIDKDGDGYLKEGEMMALAKLVGFDGDATEWKQEYATLCEEVNVSPAKGVPKERVLKMLDDKSDTGCYCTNEELKLLLLSQPRAGARRKKEAEGSDAKVRFKGASPETSEDVLRKFFGKAGEVQGLNLFKLKDGGSRGMGMVSYKTSKQAQQALVQLNDSKVEGWKINVYTDTENGRAAGQKHYVDEVWGYDPRQHDSYHGWYGEEAAGVDWYGGSSDSWEGGHSDGCVLHFMGAPLDMKRDKLYSMFAECGRIKGFWLFQLPDGRSRGQGLVEYASQKGARSCINYLNGWSIAGYTLTVQEDRVAGSAPASTWKAPHSASGYQASGYQASGYQGHDDEWWDGQSIFFSGAPSQLPVGKVQAYFQDRGALDSFHMFRHPSGKPRGIGVVRFVDPSAAAEVLANGMDIEGWQLFLREAEARQEKGLVAPSNNQHWSSYQEDWGHSSANVDPAKSIFFANVPFESTEMHLKRRLAQAGVINSFQLFKRQDGSSRGMGVVEYVTTAAARRACNTLSETDIDGRQVLIQPYNRQGYSNY